MILSGAIIFPFLAFHFFNAAADGSHSSFLFRRRRQTDQAFSGFLSPDFFCALQCSVGHSTAWSKVSDVNTPIQKTSAFMLPVMTANGAAVLNDTFNSLCVVYRSYSNCLQTCPPGVLSTNMRQGVTGLSVLCDPNKSGHLSQTPCLYNNNQAIQDTCKDANEQLFAASAALQNLYQSNDVGRITKALPSIRELCSSANKQANCLLPAVQQRCGDQATDLLQSILNASMSNLRQMLGKDNMAPLTSPECVSLFHTLENGMKINFITPANVSSSTLDNSTSNATLANKSDLRPVSSPPTRNETVFRNMAGDKNSLMSLASNVNNFFDILRTSASLCLFTLWITALMI